MKYLKRSRAIVTGVATSLVLAFGGSIATADVDLGDVVASGSAEIGGIPGERSGGKEGKAKFEEYRETGLGGWIVPELRLFLGGKKEDFFVSFDSTKPGFRDQNYRLRFGLYGLLDIEAEWDQIPHLFDEGVSRTPFRRDGGTFHLDSKPTTNISTSAHCDAQPATNFCHFLDKDNTRPVDLGLLYGIGRLKIKYMPLPGWTFNAGFWSQHVVGDRAFSTLFGPSPGNYNIVELPEPIDYQMHNVELGAEYATDWWSLGLKYNGSFFHNNTSTLIWDNPLNLSGIDGGCSDSATYSNATNGTDANRGPCRGRLDLYPSNQAHTLTLTGTANLPWKTRFMGTASYGWRLQDDKFLPFTINSAITQPSISARSLDGDVRPTMINATLVNNAIDHLNLKGFYRFYDLDNQSRRVSFPEGIVINDQAGSAASPVCTALVSCPEAGEKTKPYAYSKQTVGFDAGYDLTRWLTVKAGAGWERMHREFREITNSDEYGVGPTVDVKPWSSLLFRASYRHLWRNPSNYHFPIDETTGNPENLAKKFDEARRDRDRVSLFAQYMPWDILNLYAGFEFTRDFYPDSNLGTQYDFNYSPSAGFALMPTPFVKIFGDLNWDRYDWRMDAMQRTASLELPNSTNCPHNALTRCWTSLGKDNVTTASIGTDWTIIEHVLGFRVQYGYSFGTSKVAAFGATCGGCTRATNYPTIKNSWHEFLARFEYQVMKNIGVKVGYYFNHAGDNDHGVDIMKPWMGDVDTGASVQKSVFLGDRIKGPFTAHVGFVALKFSF
jgi:MtrB/PioB family decaheme-associated outer membrane protein